MENTYLAHHGILGQKWGIRRFQNEDGSLTDEGYRHYGYGKVRGNGRIKNTLERTKQGGKIGAVVGSATAIGDLGLKVAQLAAAGAIFNPTSLISAGILYTSIYALSGYASGSVYGAIAGAVETKQGRKYIESHDKELKEFEMRDLNKKD